MQPALIGPKSDNSMPYHRRAVIILSSKIFPLIFLFVEKKQEKQEKQETFPKVGNLTEGKLIGRVRIPIFRKKKENMEIQKIAPKENLEI